MSAVTFRQVMELTSVFSEMKKLWRPGSAVAAASPLRVDLCGMTDYIPAESWCVNTTLTGLTARLRVAARDDDLVRINAGTYGTTVVPLADVEKTKGMFPSALVRHNYADIYDFGMDVKVNCEFGAIGLSSSSSVASLFNVALGLICGEPYDPLTIARQTQAIEPHWYGRQDQLSVAFGGLNLWHMSPGTVEEGVAVRFGEIERYPIIMPIGFKEKLCHECFLIYDSGIEEGASGVLERVADSYESDPALRAAFGDLNELAQGIHCILSRPKGDVKWLYQLGDTFDAIREAHERLHPSVTNQRMQDLFKAARKAGALGGRYSGAGGRGALTFICKPGETAKVTAALDSVSTPHKVNGRTFTRGRQIHFGSFGDTCAHAWFAG